MTVISRGIDCTLGSVLRIRVVVGMSLEVRLAYAHVSWWDDGPIRHPSPVVLGSRWCSSGIVVDYWFTSTRPLRLTPMNSLVVSAEHVTSSRRVCVISRMMIHLE